MQLLLQAHQSFFHLELLNMCKDWQRARPCACKRVVRVACSLHGEGLFMQCMSSVRRSESTHSPDSCCNDQLLQSCACNEQLRIQKPRTSTPSTNPQHDDGNDDCTLHSQCKHTCAKPAAVPQNFAGVLNSCNCCCGQALWITSRTETRAALSFCNSCSFSCTYGEACCHVALTAYLFERRRLPRYCDAYPRIQLCCWF